MIDSKQVCQMLISVKGVSRHDPEYAHTLLDAIYASADEQALRVLKDAPDIRDRLKVVRDAQVRAGTERIEFQKLIETLQGKLDPSLLENKDSDDPKDEG